MKRPWTELALQSLVVLFFAVLSIPDLSSAGQYGLGALDRKDLAAQSGIFQLDTATASDPSYENNPGTIFNRHTFGQTV